MAADASISPAWIVVRPDDDLNWWLDETSEDVYWIEGGLSILDPRQVGQLLQALDEYRAYGFGKERFASAFRPYTLQAELSDGRLRLARVDDERFHADAQLFALPLVQEKGAGAYYEFLDTLSAARIRLLNATHHYAHDCTEFEMEEELEAIDRDRYFSAEYIHVFDEINEILEWKPAEWEDSDT